MPWKNGLGKTSEVAVFPDGSDLSRGDFLWRVSSAHVGAANSFSNFQGYDRILTVIDGEGLILNGNVLEEHQVCRFSGEDSFFCELVNGAVDDLGVIVKRDQYRAELTIETIDSSAKSISCDDGIHFFFAIGSFVILNPSLRLERGDSLKVVGPRSIHFKSVSGLSSLVKISIYKK